MDWIALEDFDLDLIIGVLAEEQLAPQPVQMRVGLGLDLEEAGETDALESTVDYAAVCADLTFLAQAGHWRLLETLALACLRHLLTDNRVERARIELRKPTILGGRAVPGIRMERARSWRHVDRMLSEGVEIEVLAVTEAVGAYRVRLKPGARWHIGSPVHFRVLDGSIFTDDLVVVAGDEAGGSGELHTEVGASLLLVARPPL